jgi:hypothetical protein
MSGKQWLINLKGETETDNKKLVGSMDTPQLNLGAHGCNLLHATIPSKNASSS